MSEAFLISNFWGPSERMNGRLVSWHSNNFGAVRPNTGAEPNGLSVALQPGKTLCFDQQDLDAE